MQVRRGHCVNYCVDTTVLLRNFATRSSDPSMEILCGLKQLTELRSLGRTAQYSLDGPRHLLMAIWHVSRTSRRHQSRPGYLDI